MTEQSLKGYDQVLHEILAHKVDSLQTFTLCEYCTDQYMYP